MKQLYVYVLYVGWQKFRFYYEGCKHFYGHSHFMVTQNRVQLIQFIVFSYDTQCVNIETQFFNFFNLIFQCFFFYSFVFFFSFSSFACVKKDLSIKMSKSLSNPWYLQLIVKKNLLTTHKWLVWLPIPPLFLPPPPTYIKIYERYYIYIFLFLIFYSN